MKFPETREERNWFSIGALLVILSFILFFVKIGYQDHASKAYPPFSKATVESHQ